MILRRSTGIWLMIMIIGIFEFIPLIRASSSEKDKIKRRTNNQDLLNKHHGFFKAKKRYIPKINVTKIDIAMDFDSLLNSETNHLKKTERPVIWKKRESNALMKQLEMLSNNSNKYQFPQSIIPITHLGKENRRINDRMSKFQLITITPKHLKQKYDNKYKTCYIQPYKQFFFGIDDIENDDWEQDTNQEFFREEILPYREKNLFNFQDIFPDESRTIFDDIFSSMFNMIPSFFDTVFFNAPSSETPKIIKNSEMGPTFHSSTDKIRNKRQNAVISNLSPQNKNSQSKLKHRMKKEIGNNTVEVNESNSNKSFVSNGVTDIRNTNISFVSGGNIMLSTANNISIASNDSTLYPKTSIEVELDSGGHNISNKTEGMSHDRSMLPKDKSVDEIGNIKLSSNDNISTITEKLKPHLSTNILPNSSAELKQEINLNKSTNLKNQSSTDVRGEQIKLFIDQTLPVLLNESKYNESIANISTQDVTLSLSDISVIVDQKNKEKKHVEPKLIDSLDMQEYGKSPYEKNTALKGREELSDVPKESESNVFLILLGVVPLLVGFVVVVGVVVLWIIQKKPFWTDSSNSMNDSNIPPQPKSSVQC